MVARLGRTRTGNCGEVEVGAYQGSGDLVGVGTCVEVSEGPLTRVRDNQNLHVQPLAFTTGAWAHFLGGLHTD